MKDLQSLQTVGPKRAKLIHEWRETYGSFSKVQSYLSKAAIQGTDQKCPFEGRWLCDSDQDTIKTNIWDYKMLTINRQLLHRGDR